VEGQGIKKQPCYGVCQATTRTLVSAQLSDNGQSITIDLNTPAADASFPCSKLFDAATVALIGPAAQCSALEGVLTVTLARGASISPQNLDSLGLAPGQRVLVDKLNTSAAFTTPAAPLLLVTCSNCKPPTVAISGPQVGVG
jgi:hypothetical protein